MWSLLPSLHYSYNGGFDSARPVLRTHSAPAIIHTYYLKARKAAKGGKPKTVKAAINYKKKKHLLGSKVATNWYNSVSLVNDECVAPWPTQVSLQLNFFLNTNNFTEKSRFDLFNVQNPSITINHTKYPTYKIKKSRKRDSCFSAHSQLINIKNYRYQGKVPDEKRWTNVQGLSMPTDPLFCLDFAEIASLTKY